MWNQFTPERCDCPGEGDAHMKSVNARTYMSSFSLHNIIRHFAHFMGMNQNGNTLRQHPLATCFLNALKYKDSK